MRDADGRPGDRPLAQPGAVPRSPAGRSRAGALHDGVLADVAPTHLRAGRPAALGRDDRDVAAGARRASRRSSRVIPSAAVHRRRSLREPIPGRSARSSSASRLSPRSCSRPGGRGCPARSAATPPSTAAGVASSAACGSSRSSCSSSSSSSRSRRSSSRRRRSEPSSAAAQPGRNLDPRMNRIDHAVIGGLLLLPRRRSRSLIGAPALAPARPRRIAQPTAAADVVAVSRGRPRPARRRQPARRPDPGRPRPRRARVLGARRPRPGRDARSRTSPERWTRRPDRQDLDVHAPPRRALARRRAGHRATTSSTRSTSLAGSRRTRGPGAGSVAGGHRDRRRRADGPVRPRRRRSAGSSSWRPSRSRRPTCSQTIAGRRRWPTIRSVARRSAPGRTS